MKFNKYRFIHICVCSLLFLVQSSQAQNKISNSVLGNGGTTISGNNNRIAGTLGQNLIGVSSNANNTSNAGFWYQTTDFVTSVEQIEADLLPGEFRLEQNYPNPFNPSTTIQFAVPFQSKVKITLFDLLGREVTTFVDEEYKPGEYKLVFEAEGLASGIYFYRIAATTTAGQAKAFVQIKKLTLLK